MNKTLGGDRLGAGKKMKVELHGYERSTHDLGYLWRSTMAAGTLVPYLNIVALPGDTLDINLNADVMTLPTNGPLFGSGKLQLDIFVTPMRLYNSLMHNNMLGIGNDMSVVKMPKIVMTAKAFAADTQDYDNAQINPSALLNYLGIKGIGKTSEDANRYFNANSILAYWDTYKNYYSNKQEGIGAFISANIATIPRNIDTVQHQNSFGTTTIQYVPDISTPSTVDSDSQLIIDWTGVTPNWDATYIRLEGFGNVSIKDFCEDLVVSGTSMTANVRRRYISQVIVNYGYMNGSNVITAKPSVQTFDLSNIDDMRKAILAYSSESDSFIVNTAGASPYNRIGAYQEEIPLDVINQQGLGLKTYQSDLFNNWLDTAWISSISSRSAVQISGGAFTMDQLNLAQKVYNILNRIAVSGGTFDDWIDAVWTNNRARRSETPMYMGGLSKEIVFQEVVSNSATASEPLGTLAGRGVMAKKHKGGKVVIKVDEPSIVMGIVSITPRIDYSQGNDWTVHLDTMDDLHKPELDQIGFQDLITEQMAWWSTEYDGTNWVQKSAGKQPAWINYMTAVNKTYGNFAIENNQMFMTFNRRYEYNDGEIGDLTTYIDPSKFNFIFAESALDAQNYWVQIGIDITARRKMSAKQIPNL